MGRAQLDNSGKFNGKWEIPTMLDRIFIQARYVGLPSVYVPVKNGYANFDFFTDASGKNGSAIQGSPQSVNSTVYNHMGTYTNDGKPNYLYNPADVITSSFLSFINSSVGNGISVVNVNPQYLAADSKTNLILNDSADVWVAFIGEGAGYKNTLGYFVYNKFSPPTSASQITEVKYIFPNSSAQGSGGSLQPGDKVYLGKFGPAQAIGWVLLQDAWNGNDVDANAQKFYSLYDFNPESTASKRQHNIMLQDNQNERVVLGFEDLNREDRYTNPSNLLTDDDFEDVMFSLSITPWSAIDKDGVPHISYTGTTDTDNDGVPDLTDEYPTDGARAFNSYVPYKAGFTSVAYEDLWPATGDYDFNDLVMNLNYKHVTNADNELVDFEYKSYIRHIGASFVNGFGIELPLDADDIASATGSNITNNLVTIDPNGVEAGQTNAVLIFFDNAFANYGDTQTVSGTLTSPYNYPTFVNDGLNPFLISNQERGREVHLPNRRPTDLADPSIFGTLSDDTNPGTGKFYKTADNKPWAISVSYDYAPPVESVNIEDAYNFWTPWVNSNGELNSDWYLNNPGFRVNGNVQ